MTPFFVAEFRKGLKCGMCAAKQARGRKFCLYHLRYAREAFANWSSKRRKAGLCILCHRRGFRGYLRCKAHRTEQNAYLRAWVAAHPERSKEQWVLKKREYRDNGLCLACKEHRPCKKGRTRCDECRVRHKLVMAGKIKPWSGTSRGGKNSLLTVKL